MDGALRVTEQARADLLRHAAAAYPREACGLLAGPPAPAPADCYLPLPNRHAGAHAFSVDDAAHVRALLALRRAHRQARAFCHSHPDAPAVPSARDLAGALLGGEPAFPGVDHVIVTVNRGQSTDARAWRLRDGAFHAVALSAAGEVPCSPRC
ncbi:MAG: Mov34/MPN/PAD-1 family protein [Deltaproteobacteria bacterium]|nr:Mov34/MPN/PAD-1 family protein [Deltaproteobacteria bacterium]